VATPHLPTSSTPSSSSSKRPLELEDRPRKPPAVPRTLGNRARRLWKELYSEPVSDLWRPSDATLVVRLIGLRERIETEGPACPLAVYGIVQGLEDRLLLNPRARRAAGVVYIAASSSRPSPNGNGKVRRLDERRRARLTRGA
jgi:hypothetical protein